MKSLILKKDVCLGVLKAAIIGTFVIALVGCDRPDTKAVPTTVIRTGQPAVTKSKTPQPVAGKEVVEIGQPAPNIELIDTKGNDHKLSEFKGKYVVLEWMSHSCPSVDKLYSTGTMQKTQRIAEKEGAVWLSIVSSPPRFTGNFTSAQHNKMAKDLKATPTAILMDPDGTVAQQYHAQVTPQMFVVDPKGMLIYKGAFDDNPSEDPASGGGAKNYVLEALKESKAGKQVTTAVTEPYGCPVNTKV